MYEMEVILMHVQVKSTQRELKASTATAASSLFKAACTYNTGWRKWASPPPPPPSGCSLEWGQTGHLICHIRNGIDPQIQLNSRRNKGSKNDNIKFIRGSLHKRIIIGDEGCDLHPPPLRLLAGMGTKWTSHLSCTNWNWPSPSTQLKEK